MARWNTCNVLEAAPHSRHLWQFGVGDNKLPLQREESKPSSEPFAAKLIEKDWRSLLQPRLNIAWLPADQVFLRAVQLPKSDAAEIYSMIELQLEKLSPLPVAQVCWSYDLLPQPFDDMVTAIVVVVPRNYVEQFLGKLEGEGYLADRLDVPLIDQLRCTTPEGNGAWLYPAVAGNESTCLIVWWYGGILVNISLVNLPPGEHRMAFLREQITQMAWAGEVEGWLNAPPRYHLVADDVAADPWRPAIPEGFSVVIDPPVPAKELAEQTARRALANNGQTGALLPAEYTARYKQQLVDRLWMRLLFGLLGLYTVGAAAYLALVWFANWRLEGTQDETRRIAGTYTNTLQLRDRVKVLRDQLELQYASLDCYLAAATNLPPELTLNSLNFDRGQKLVLFGSAATEDRLKITDFNEALLKVTVHNLPLFKRVNAPTINNTGPQTLLWNFSAELRRSDSNE